MIGTMLRLSTLLIMACTALAFGDFWNGAEINWVRLYNEKTISFNVTTMNCSGAPCTATISFVVEANPSNWPSHTTGDVKAFQAMMLTALSSKKKINVDFSWNGYIMPGASGGGYFLNWMEIPK